MPLLEALGARGGRVVLISSLSAFRGARSRYGQAKLELEKAVLERGGAAVRPGVVFGARPGGLFAAICASVARTRVLPLPGGGSQRLFLSRDEELCELVAQIADDRFTPGRAV